MSEKMPITIYGASDDLFELETPDRSIYEEYDCWDRPCTVHLESPSGETMLVRGEFTANGWVLEVLENDWNWAVENSVRPDRPSDPAIIVHAPVRTIAKEIV